ncbi:MAG: hypothetical protein A2V93_04670 [Ignavibacteria bacterium RBG_16_34_14]|nr:MAG: hypothetical protein A2V93_04670 [Ignavibacteria bacterium RBG_16_34_14]
MIRRYFLFGLITLLCSVSVYAQYKQTGGAARLRGMGNNPYVVDPYIMTVNPAWGGHYHNFLFGDLGFTAGAFQPGGVGQFVAANFHVGGGLALGGMLVRNDFLGFGIGSLDPAGLVGQINSYLGNAGFPLPTTTSGTHVVPLNNNLELMGSIKSGNTVIGLGVAYASTTNELKPDTGTGAIGSASQLGFNAGIVTKLTGSFLLDLGASFMMPSTDFEPQVGTKTEFSQTLIIVNARAFWEYSSKLEFVPSVAFITASGTSDLGTTTGTTTSVDLPSYTLISVGIGMNYEVGDFLLAGGPGFALISATWPAIENVRPEFSTSAFVFPVWNLGGEWNMNDWFVARVGYVASTQSVTTETPVSATAINEMITTQFFGPQGATVGCGFRLGNFSLDATVNEDVLRQGFNNIGGGGPTFAYISLSYAMP